MQIAISRILVLVISLLFAGSSYAEELQIGLSRDTVPVDSSFNGTRIFVFGSIDEVDALDLGLSGYSIVVAVNGPSNDLVVRKKERVLGIWVNTHSRSYADVPGYYAVVSSEKLGVLVRDEALKEAKLGVSNIDYKPLQNGIDSQSETNGDFADALRRIRMGNTLFSETPGRVDYLGKSLFRAAVDLPANVPIGRHQVTTYLFKDSVLLDQKSVSFAVRKVGFERWMYDLAHQNSLLYGILAVLLAIFTGWFANLVFRKD